MPGRLTRLQTLDTRSTETRPRPRLKPRGMPVALEPHGVYVATSPAEAELYGRDLWGTHRIHITDGQPEDFVASFHGVLVRDVSLGYLEFSTGVRIAVEQLGNSFLVLIPTTGTASVSSGRTEVVTSPITAAVLASGSRSAVHAPATCAHLIVGIDRGVLERHLSRMLGRLVSAPIEFELAFELSQATSNRWNTAVQLLQNELIDATSLLRTGVGQGQLEEFVMGALLYSHRSNYSDQLRAAIGPERRALTLARQFIEQHLTEPISVADIAYAAGVSVRTIQKLFGDELGTTPTGYVRMRRLERAREDLADASPASRTTVSGVATRWGFTHLGRFSVTYRRAFGETPSQTLRS